MSEDFAGVPCADCGGEECATVHMEASGHDYRAGKPRQDKAWPPSDLESKTPTTETK